MTPEGIRRALLAPAASRAEKLGQFAIGFLGTYLVNGLVLALSVWLISLTNSLAQTAGAILSAAPFILNIAALGILALIPRLRWTALGVLAAIGLALCLVLLASVLFLGFCFVLLACSGQANCGSL